MYLKNIFVFNLRSVAIGSRIKKVTFTRSNDFPGAKLGFPRHQLEFPGH